VSTRVDKELVLLKEKFTDLLLQASPFKVYIHKEVQMLENLLSGSVSACLPAGR